MLVWQIGTPMIAGQPAAQHSLIRRRSRAARAALLLCLKTKESDSSAGNLN